jgi:hypothetical protein
MNHAILALTLATSLLVAPSARQQTRTSGARTISTYVTVLDGGKPAAGVTAADVAVREDGTTREVLKVVPATEPMQIVVLIDDSQAAMPALQSLRDGLSSFVTRLAGKADIGLVTIGERPTSLLEHTTDTAALKKGIGRIFARPGAGTYFTDGLVDVSKGLQKREVTRPVIVAVLMEAIEYSSTTSKQALEALYASGATLHVLAVGTPASSTEDEMLNRNQTIAEGTEKTGGRRDQLLSHTALDDRLKQLADELLQQYMVSYNRPETLIPPEKVQVTVTRPGLTVRARTRAGAR